MPMALQSVTPFRNVLIPDKNSAEATTPAALRAALGMTPVEMGAKAKMRHNQLCFGRPSLDLLTRRSTRGDIQHKFFRFLLNLCSKSIVRWSKANQRSEWQWLCGSANFRKTRITNA